MAWNRAQRRLSKFATDVYRVYDIHGQLLYVGASVNVFTRLRAHRQYAEWWPLAHEATVTRYENRRMARHVEAIAIREERPQFNVTDERSEAMFRIEVTEPIEVLDLFWEDGRVWVDAT